MQWGVPVVSVVMAHIKPQRLLVMMLKTIIQIHTDDRVIQHCEMSVKTPAVWPFSDSSCTHYKTCCTVQPCRGLPGLQNRQHGDWLTADIHGTENMPAFVRLPHVFPMGGILDSGLVLSAGHSWGACVHGASSAHRPTVRTHKIWHEM